ncbi:MAG: thiamine biosynthesis protein ThiS [Paenibacillaceae bacterium ZCTH02-B3]|nr:MAG: thiamine biosynthesis protein ThiS [Paenibacillaceae bacterium ZCTH02-B3]
MKLTVNGKAVEWPAESGTLSDLVQHYRLRPNLVIAEVDGRVVRREEWPNVALADGMTVELVQFVGGG